MSQAKHTPGPWEWSDKYRTADSERNTWSLLGDGGYGILSCDGDENSPQSLGKSGEANARLIAAAPELLDALRSMLVQFNFNTITGIVHDESAVIVKAREAIAKATGGE